MREAVFGPVLCRPSDAELAEGLDLLEFHRRMTIELKNRQKARNDYSLDGSAGDELPERHSFAVAQECDDVSGLLADAYKRGMQVIETEHGNLARREREQGQRGEVLRAECPDELWRLLSVLLFEAHRTKMSGGFDLHCGRKPLCCLFERSVLQQPGKEQVARVEKGDVFSIH